jgi:hypothetical protein
MQLNRFSLPSRRKVTGRGSSYGFSTKLLADRLDLPPDQIAKEKFRRVKDTIEGTAGRRRSLFRADY